MSEEAFQNSPRTVKLSTGEEIPLPRLTLGKILAVTKSMQNLISAVKDKSPEIMNLFGGEAPENAGAILMGALPSLVGPLLEEIVIVLSDYLGKPSDWIKENMDMEDLVAVATPFFGDIFKQGNVAMVALGKAFPTKTQTPEISTDQSQS